MNDTSKAVEAKYREMLLSLPPQRRFYLAAGCSPMSARQFLYPKRFSGQL